MNGRVLLVGGSEEFVGAPYLAGIAALRAGAESVIVMAPTKIAWALNTLSPDLMTRKLKGKYLSPAHKKTILKQLKTADVLLLGNGAGVRPSTAALMRFLVRWTGLKVIDADGLKVLKGSKVQNAILTPNAREWKMLSVHNDIRKLLAKNIIIKKGLQTEIFSGKKKFTMPRVNPGLQKAGTGDVLAGLCAGFLAQGLPLFTAAKKAAMLGNRIADILTAKKKGYYFLASDLAEELKKLHRLIRTNKRMAI
jgi:NAD(P)H-hydrate epimerase